MLNVNALGLPFKPLVCNHPAPVMDGCVLYLDGRYGGNNPATQTWYDLSGMGNDGTLNNFAYAEGSGWTGKGLGFDGVDDYVDCGNDASLLLDKQCTITAWIKPGSDEPINQDIIGSTAHPNYNWLFRLSKTSLEFRAWENATGTSIKADGVITIGEFVFVSAVVDLNAGHVKLGKNGNTILQQDFAVSTLKQYPEITTKVGLYATSPNVYFKGEIYNIAIYNRALSPREITQNYLASRCIMPLRHIDNATTPAEILQNELAAKFCPLFHDHYNTAGVEWEVAQSTKMTRLGTTANKTAGSDFNNIYPWSEIKLCNVNDDGEITAYIGDSGFKRDGTNGQVMVKIPKFYYRHVYGEAAKKHQFWISEHPISGFKLHPAFIRAGVEKEYVMMGAYKAGAITDVDDGGKIKLTSVSGSIPAVSRTRATFRTQAHNRGDSWYIVDALARNAVSLLYLVEYADTNCQTAIGQGIVNLRYNVNDKAVKESTEPNTIIVSSAIGDYFKVGQVVGIGTSLGGGQVCQHRTITKIEPEEGETGNVIITVDGNSFTTVAGNIVYHVGQKTGGCDSLDGESGRAPLGTDGEAGVNGQVSVSYRGIEDLWGNVWEFIDGINIKNSEKQPYIADSNFADDTFTGDYIASGITLPAGNGYCGNFAASEDADWLLMPNTLGGSTSTYIPDYFYQNWANTADKVALAGGRWNDGNNAGLFYWNVSSSGDAYISIGARPLQIP